jgi:hypothetical protein
MCSVNVLLEPIPSAQAFSRKFTKTEVSLESSRFGNLFAAKHKIGSDWTQKTFDRALKELSIGVNFNEIRRLVLKLQPVQFAGLAQRGVPGRSNAKSQLSGRQLIG